MRMVDKTLRVLMWLGLVIGLVILAGAPLISLGWRWDLSRRSATVLKSLPSICCAASGN